jgi:release factor glutamine methyltransferase
LPDPSEAALSIDQLLHWARQELKQVNIASASLDARLLLQHGLGCTHADLIANGDCATTAEQATKFRELVNRRKTFEPVSKITGQREFYGQNFRVSRAVLDPRPDTETVIDVCLAHFPADRSFRFADLGTGSGAIGITLACERKHANGVCADISTEALVVAKLNVDAHGLQDRILLCQSNWFQNIEGPFDLIVSNPPYIQETLIAALAPDVRDHDPFLALSGGRDGLECYREIAAGASTHMMPHGSVVIETGIGQQRQIEAIFANHDFKLSESRPDLAGRIRALLFTK